MAPSFESMPLTPAPSPPLNSKKQLGHDDETISFGASPYAFTCKADKIALLVIDMQRDFLLAGGFGHIQAGDAGVETVQQTIKPILKTLQAFRDCGLQVIHTREGHRQDLRNCPSTKLFRQARTPNTRHKQVIGDRGAMGRLLTKGEYGHDIIDELRPLRDELVIDKPGKGSFFSTTLHQQLVDRGITHLVICGVTVECCVSTTVREANDRGFEVCVLSDCTDGFVPDFKSSSLDMVCYSDGLFGFVSSSSPAIQALEQYKTRRDQQGSTWDKSLEVANLRRQYRAGLSPRTVAKDVLRRIEEADAENPGVWVTKAEAADVLKRAAELEESGNVDLPLFGVPFGVKDSIDVVGYPTTAACPAYAYQPEKNARVIDTLLAAGAIFIGKTNLDQFATGLVGVRSPYGTPHSVFSKDYVSGGSSSGSALAAALDLVSFTVGTDTAGSGRVPAAFNGVIGLKPTGATISVEGLVPACRQIDNITFFSRTLNSSREPWLVAKTYEDADTYMSVARRYMPTPGCRSLLTEDTRYTFAMPPSGLVGQYLCPEYMDAFNAVRTATKSLANASEATFDFAPYMKAATLMYRGAFLAERTSEFKDFLLDPANASSIHPAVKEILDAGLKVSATEAFEDLHLARDLTHQVAKQFDSVDVLVIPTAPRHPTLKDLEQEPVKANLALGVFASAVNVLDLCALAVPAGTVTIDGTTLPFGITLAAPAGREGVLFEVASRLERAIKRTR